MHEEWKLGGQQSTWWKCARGRGRVICLAIRKAHFKAFYSFPCEGYIGYENKWTWELEAFKMRVFHIVRYICDSTWKLEYRVVGDGNVVVTAVFQLFTSQAYSYVCEREGREPSRYLTGPWGGIPISGREGCASTCIDPLH